VQALVAQEMKKWMQGKQGTDSQGPSDGSFSPFAHFAGVYTLHTHSNICCYVTKGWCDSWIINIGASDHMTFEQTSLTQPTKPLKPISVTLPDGTTKPVSQIGQVS